MMSSEHIISVDICVCTFRRPVLENALRSLLAMEIPAGTVVRIIVSDNDDGPSARSVVDRVASGSGLDFVYLHSPARNISIARNACLSESNADYVVFIDDDEIVTTRWLVALLQRARASNADIVLGPVKAIYDTAAPAWMKRADLHSTVPVFVSGTIRTGYTCNVLMRSAARSVSGRRFNLARGTTGGEDTEFFAGVTASGGTIDYAPEAWVTEIVTPERARLGWLMRRKYRMGQTHGQLRLRSVSLIELPRLMAVTTAKIAYCFGMAAATFVSPARAGRNLLRGVMHLGALSGLLGRKELTLYGASSDGSAA